MFTSFPLLPKETPGKKVGFGPGKPGYGKIAEG
jgi:hypothetical protein